jgi:hypothetical protein
MAGSLIFISVGNGLDKRLEIAPLMQKGVRRHVAASPETFSGWSIRHREKQPVTAFSSSISLAFSRTRERKASRSSRDVAQFINKINQQKLRRELP